MTFEKMRNPLRAKLRDGSTSYGLWITLADPVVTELVCMLGVDWIVVDMEHGRLGLADLLSHAQAARGSGVAVLTRVPGLEAGVIGRALDLGIDGVIVPYVKGAHDIRDAFRQARFPPEGERGIGGERASHWGMRMADYLATANEETLVIPLIETREAAADIDAILDIEGLECIFLGPADFSASQGFTGQWEGPGVAEALLDIKASADVAGVATGIVGRTGADQVRRRDQGFRMIGIGSDAGFIADGVKARLREMTGIHYDHSGLS